jgi:hypothetical protein
MRVGPFDLLFFAALALGIYGLLKGSTSLLVLGGLAALAILVATSLSVARRWRGGRK